MKQRCKVSCVLSPLRVTTDYDTEESSVACNGEPGDVVSNPKVGHKISVPCHMIAVNSRNPGLGGCDIEKMKTPVSSEPSTPKRQRTRSSGKVKTPLQLETIVRRSKHKSSIKHSLESVNTSVTASKISEPASKCIYYRQQYETETSNIEELTDNVISIPDSIPLQTHVAKQIVTPQMTQKIKHKVSCCDSGIYMSDMESRSVSLTKKFSSTDRVHNKSGAKQCEMTEGMLHSDMDTVTDTIPSSVEELQNSNKYSHNSLKQSLLQKYGSSIAKGMHSKVDNITKAVHRATNNNNLQANNSSLHIRCTDSHRPKVSICRMPQNDAMNVINPESKTSIHNRIPVSRSDNDNKVQNVSIKQTNRNPPDSHVADNTFTERDNIQNITKKNTILNGCMNSTDVNVSKQVSSSLHLHHNPNSCQNESTPCNQQSCADDNTNISPTFIKQNKSKAHKNAFKPEQAGVIIKSTSLSIKDGRKLDDLSKTQSRKSLPIKNTDKQKYSRLRNTVENTMDHSPQDMQHKNQVSVSSSPDTTINNSVVCSEECDLSTRNTKIQSHTNLSMHTDTVVSKAGNKTKTTQLKTARNRHKEKKSAPSTISKQHIEGAVEVSSASCELLKQDTIAFSKTVSDQCSAPSQSMDEINTSTRQLRSRVKGGSQQSSQESSQGAEQATKQAAHKGKPKRVKSKPVNKLEYNKREQRKKVNIHSFHTGLDEANSTENIQALVLFSSQTDWIRPTPDVKKKPPCYAAMNQCNSPEHYSPDPYDFDAECSSVNTCSSVKHNRYKKLVNARKCLENSNRTDHRISSSALKISQNKSKLNSQKCSRDIYDAVSYPGDDNFDHINQSDFINPNFLVRTKNKKTYSQKVSKYESRKFTEDTTVQQLANSPKSPIAEVLSSGNETNIKGHFEKPLAEALEDKSVTDKSVKESVQRKDRKMANQLLKSLRNHKSSHDVQSIISNETVESDIENEVSYSANRKNNLSLKELFTKPKNRTVSFGYTQNFSTVIDHSRDIDTYQFEESVSMHSSMTRSGKKKETNKNHAVVNDIANIHVPHSWANIARKRDTSNQNSTSANKSTPDRAFDCRNAHKKGKQKDKENQWKDHVVEHSGARDDYHEVNDDDVQEDIDEASIDMAGDRHKTTETADMDSASAVQAKFMMLCQNLIKKSVLEKSSSQRCCRKAVNYHDISDSECDIDEATPPNCYHTQNALKDDENHFKDIGSPVKGMKTVTSRLMATEQSITPKTPSISGQFSNVETMPNDFLHETPLLLCGILEGTPSASYDMLLATPSLSYDIPGATLSHGYDIPRATPSLGYDIPGETPSLGYDIPGETPSLGYDILGETPSLAYDDPVAMPSPSYDISGAIPSLAYDIRGLTPSLPYDDPEATPLIPYNIPEIATPGSPQSDRLTDLTGMLPIAVCRLNEITPLPLTQNAEMVPTYRLDDRFSVAQSTMEKALMSGPTSGQRPNKSALKRKCVALKLSNLDDDNDYDDDGLAEDTGVVLKPRKLFKGNTPETVFSAKWVSTVQSTWDSRSSVESSNSEHDINETDSLEKDVQMHLAGVLSSLRSSVVQHFQNKQEAMQQLARTTVQNTHSHVTDAMQAPKSTRSKIVEKFEKKVFHELLALEKDVEKLNQAEDNVLVFFKQQLRVLQSCRISQENSLRSLRSLQLSMNEELHDVDMDDSKQQESAKANLLVELTRMQSNIIRYSNKQQLTNLQKCLSKVFH